MHIADHNVYGVDLNPIAVELAEVSLWLNALGESSAVPWFGYQLFSGNSLIGARRQVYGADQVLGIEYDGDLRDSFADACADPDRPGSLILRDRDLAPKGAAGHVFQACP